MYDWLHSVAGDAFFFFFFAGLMSMKEKCINQDCSFAEHFFVPPCIFEHRCAFW